ncbi:MAG TPA: hypothetical protein ENI29_00220 [bacterium]|nr:hypothetical protein [bacterium]
MKIECLWCGIVVYKIRHPFCCLIHRRYYERFREGFKSEMHYLKTKPKVIDSPKYQRMRHILTSIKPKYTTVMSKL